MGEKPVLAVKVVRPVNKSFHAYTGTPLGIAGQVLVDVECNDLQLTLL